MTPRGLWHIHHIKFKYACIFEAWYAGGKFQKKIASGIFSFKNCVHITIIILQVSPSRDILMPAHSYILQALNLCALLESGTEFLP